MSNICIDSSNGFLRYTVDKTDLLLMEEVFERRFGNNNKLNNSTVYENNDSRKAGILGETIFHSIFPDAIKSPEIDIQYDFILEDYKIDVKCKLRKNAPKIFFEASIFEYQSKFELDEYVFMSTVPDFNFIWLCGNISKINFINHPNLQKWKSGQIDKSNGMKFKRDTFSLKYKYLKQFEGIYL